MNAREVKVMSKLRRKTRTDSPVIAQLFEEAQKQGLTQAELGEAVGSDQKVMSRLKVGTSNPSVKRLEQLAEVLNMKVVLVPKDDRDSIRSQSR